MGGGDVKKQMAQQNAITQQQLGVASEQSRREAESYNQAKQWIAPYADKLAALTQPGNRKGALEAFMGMGGDQVSGSYANALAALRNQIAPGAARDKAESDLAIQRALAMGQGQAQAVQQGYSALAQLGQGQQGYGLQQLGATLSAFQGGGQTNQAALNAAVEQQKAKLNFFGNLVKTATGFVNPTGWFTGAPAANPQNAYGSAKTIPW